MAFICIHCQKRVDEHAPGTQHRNHCPFCLWSKHLDLKTPGDRQANCSGPMEPLGLAYKSEGGRKQGELSVVNRCQLCGAVSKNRLAGDDDAQTVLALYRQSLEKPAQSGVELLAKNAEREIITQLFGKPYAKKYFQPT